jgi:hypothetical protein
MSYGSIFLGIYKRGEPVDLREWNISKDLALDRGAWRLAINVPEP